MTVTFAVIVASFVAGKRLVPRLRLVVAGLYVLSVIVFLSRWYYAASDAELFKSALNEAGVLVVTPWVTFISRLALITLGTVAPLVFLLREDVYSTSDD